MILLFKTVRPNTLRDFGDVFFVEHLEILMHVVRAFEGGGSGFSGSESITEFSNSGLLLTGLN